MCTFARVPLGSRGSGCAWVPIYTPACTEDPACAVHMCLWAHTCRHTYVLYQLFKSKYKLKIKPYVFFKDNFNLKFNIIKINGKYNLQ